MDPYRVPFLLLTSLTCLGFVQSPGRSVITSTPAATQPLPAVQRLASSHVPTRLSGEILLSQDSPPKDQQPKFSFKPPMGLLVLGVGSVIVTAGAVFILIRLLGNSAEQEQEEEITPEEITQSSSTVLPNPEVNAVPPQVMFETPETFPTEPEVKTHIQPPEPLSSEAIATEKNGYKEVIPAPVQQQPSLAENAQTFLIEDKSRLPAVDAVEQLILDLRESNPTQRQKAIWELGQTGDSRAIQPLVDLLYTSDSKQRSLILSTLSEIGTRTLKPMSRALTFSLQDENAEVRKNAIRDLTRIYDLVTQMSQLLQRAADDPDPDVRETAHWASNKLSRLRPTLPRGNSDL